MAKREYSDGIPEIPITRYTMLEKLFQCLCPNSSEKKMGNCFRRELCGLRVNQQKAVIMLPGIW